MKTCKSCLIKMSVSNFTKSKNVKDGYENKCKSCRIEQRKIHVIECVSCGTNFKTAYKKSRYCSQGCKPQSQRNRVKVLCFVCEDVKEIVPSRAKEYKHFYCSDECKNKGFSLLYSGENSPKYNTISCECFTCGSEFHRWESQIEKYERSYCSLKCKSEDYKHRFNGSDNSNYNESRNEIDRIRGRNIKGYQEWRRSVYKRDGFTCMCCGDNRGGNLIAHHIKNYTEYKNLRIETNNGITLCETCHKCFHDEYGYRNNDDKQLRNFIMEHKKALIPQ